MFIRKQIKDNWNMNLRSPSICHAGSLYENRGVITLSPIGWDEIVDIFDIDEQFKSYITILFGNLKQVMHSWDD